MGRRAERGTGSALSGEFPEGGNGGKDEKGKKMKIEWSEQKFQIADRLTAEAVRRCRGRMDEQDFTAEGRRAGREAARVYPRPAGCRGFSGCAAYCVRESAEWPRRNPDRHFAGRRLPRSAASGGCCKRMERRYARKAGDCAGPAAFWHAARRQGGKRYGIFRQTGRGCDGHKMDRGTPPEQSYGRPEGLQVVLRQWQAM